MYFDIRETVDELTDAEAAKLFRAILNYADLGEVPDFSGDDRVLRIAWANVKHGIDHDQERYDAICEKRREAGHTGGNTKAANAKAAAEGQGLDEEPKPEAEEEPEPKPEPKPKPPIVFDREKVINALHAARYGSEEPEKQTSAEAQHMGYLRHLHEKMQTMESAEAQRICAGMSETDRVILRQMEHEN